MSSDRILWQIIPEVYGDPDTWLLELTSEYSDAEIIGRAGLPRGTWWHWKHAERTPTIESMIEVDAALGRNGADALQYMIDARYGENFIPTLREALAVCGVPIAELARRAGYEPRVLYRWWSGERTPDLKAKLILDEAFVQLTEETER